MTVRATAAIDSEPGSTPVFTAVLGSRQRPGPHISRHTCTAMPQRCHVYNRTHLEFPVGERQRRAGYLRPTTHTPTLSQTHAHTHTHTHPHTPRIHPPTHATNTTSTAEGPRTCPDREAISFSGVFGVGTASPCRSHLSEGRHLSELISARHPLPFPIEVQQ